MSFRQFGGMNYASRHNAVSSNYNTANNLLVTQNVGQAGSYINFLSDISGNITLYGDLDISGNISISGSLTGTTGSFTYLYSVNASTSSDYRIKENVTPLNNSYVVDELIPVTYTNKLTERQDMGLIAHELQEVYPFLVHGEKDGKDYQSVNYTGLIPLLIKEVKWLKNELAQLKQQINKINNKID
jgi:hypothetical protein